MTGITFQGGVCSDQRKTIEVFARLLNRYLPPLHGVALFAIHSKLPLVNIGMAVRALRPDIGKYRAGVALHAGDLLVHAEQRIAGLVVIKFRLAANRFPAGEGMAVVACHIQRSVRAPRLLRALLLACRRRPRHRHHQRK